LVELVIDRPRALAEQVGDLVIFEARFLIATTVLSEYVNASMPKRETT
jgi:hypothetical protein